MTYSIKIKETRSKSLALNPKTFKILDKERVIKMNKISKEKNNLAIIAFICGGLGLFLGLLAYTQGFF